MNEIPSIYVYYDGTYYPYLNSLDSPTSLLHFINRLLHPLVYLKSKASIESFLSTPSEHSELTKFMLPTGTSLRPSLSLGHLYQSQKYKTRVIVCIYNKGDYEEELSAIRDIARKSAGMLNLRIGLVSDPRMVKTLKKETSWFGDATLNTMILKRYDG